MIKISINLDNIEEHRIKPGKNGRYIDIVLFTNREGPDRYGNDGFASHDVTKEEREAGTRGAILGNWRDTAKSGQGQQGQSQPRGQSAPRRDERPRPLPPAQRSYGASYGRQQQREPQRPTDRKPAPPKDPDLDPDDEEEIPF